MAMPPLDLTTESDQGLFAACQEVARAVLWRSGGDSSDVVETQAAKYFAIARDHQDFVRGQRDDDIVIENAVRYLARVHAIPPMGTDTFWFSNSLSVLIELAVPNSGLDEISAAVMPDLQVGIIQALGTVPIPRDEVRLSEDDTETIDRLTDAATEHSIAFSMLKLLERVFHGDHLDSEDQRFIMLASLASPLAARAREKSED